MKIKLYAIGAVILSILVGVISAFSSRSKADSSKVANFKESLESKKAEEHEKAAYKAHDKAQEHLKKAQEISDQKVAKRAKSIDDAVKNWNDDEI
mgnify:CR=1 FL=1